MTGYTKQNVSTLTNAQLVDEALQSGYDAGYYAAGIGDDSPRHIDARDRRNATFAEIKRRLAAAEQLAEACRATAAIEHLTYVDGGIERCRFCDHPHHAFRRHHNKWCAIALAEVALADRGGR